MFERMPEVPKGKYKVQQSHPKRFPWILGVGGCLILLLCVALAGLGSWFFLAGPGNALVQKQNAPAATPINTNVAARGKIAYSVELGSSPEGKSVWVMKADGSDTKKILDRASSPAFSPDGTRVAYYRWNEGIFVANADGTQPRKVVGESHAKYLAWSHDGAWIAFSSQPIQREGANVNIDAVRADGSQRRTIIVGGSMPSWSPDDKELVFHTCRGDCGIYKVSAFGGEPALLVGESGGNPAWSPDGNKIVYHADTDTVKQIFTINADGTGRKQITTGTVLHVDPIWSPDGGLIYYRSPEGGSWGIWRMNPDGSNQVKIAESGPPVDWAYERLAVAR
ncbi:MAG: PD40 domain-containing protein [Chloroflexi bacterium]|nr:PD40 domain-containing protein [Chloroflexota bacterium]